MGGSILNSMFKRMNRFSRIIACGAISGYNARDTVNLNNIFEVITMRITMQGACCGRSSGCALLGRPLTLLHHPAPLAPCQSLAGFIIIDFMNKWPAAIEAVKKAIKEGKFTTEGTETLVKAKFEDVPQVWQRLFSVSTHRFTLRARWNGTDCVASANRARTRASLSPSSRRDTVHTSGCKCNQ